MSDQNRNRLERIVDAAFGLSDGSLVAVADRSKLEQFKKVARVLSYEFEDAPHTSVSKAKAIMPLIEKRRLKVRLLGTSLGTAAARFLPGDEAQFVLGAGDTRVRLMFAKSPEGWTILGSVNEPDWVATCGQSTIACDDDGRFQFEVREGHDTSIHMATLDAEFDVPPVEELR